MRNQRASWRRNLSGGAGCLSETSLIDWLKLVASVATPLTVAVFGYFLNQRLKSIDDAQWQSRKITEKRIELFDEIAPELNKVFCFCTFLGYWKDISPEAMLESKRELDKKVNINRHLLSDEFYKSYEGFIHLAFSTFTGWGQDAKIRAAVASGMADRKKHANYDWKQEFASMFDEQSIPPRQEFLVSYSKAMEALRNCIGLDGG